MPFNMGSLTDLMEMQAGLAGVNKDRINPVFLRDIVNLMLRDFCEKTRCVSTKATINSVANQQEYELPDDFLHMKEVIFDDYRVDKITHENVVEILGNVS